MGQQQADEKTVTKPETTPDLIDVGAPRRFDLGVVPSHGLGRLLLRIAERRLTGRLILTGEDTERVLFFAAGYPIFAQSTHAHERLGAIALQGGIVNEATLADVLANAQASDSKLGRVLLDRAILSGAELFALLGLQLLTQLTAACLEPERRAVFIADSRTPRDTTVLFMQPMTPVLAAIDTLRESERQALVMVTSRLRVATTEFSDPASRWLRDLGYSAHPSALLNLRMPISSLRARLIARGALIARTAYDVQAVPLAAAFGTEGPPGCSRDAWPATHDLADRVLLALLLAGALEPVAEPDEPPPRDSSTETDIDHVGAVRWALVHGDPPADLLPEAEPEAAPGRVSVEEAVHQYLNARRVGDLAARMAVWGAAAEVEDAPSELDDLLMLYLTVKPEGRPERVLAFEHDATPESARENHANYQTFLDTLRTNDPDPLFDAKLAEVDAHLDRALAAFQVTIGLAPDAAAAPGHSGIAPAGSTAAQAVEPDETRSTSDRPTLDRPASDPPPRSGIVPAGSTAGNVSAAIAALGAPTKWRMPSGLEPALQAEAVPAEASSPPLEEQRGQLDNTILAEPQPGRSLLKRVGAGRALGLVFAAIALVGGLSWWILSPTDNAADAAVSGGLQQRPPAAPPTVAGPAHALRDNHAGSAPEPTVGTAAGSVQRDAPSSTREVPAGPHGQPHGQPQRQAQTARPAARDKRVSPPAKVPASHHARPGAQSRATAVSGKSALEPGRKDGSGSAPTVSTSNNRKRPVSRKLSVHRPAAKTKRPVSRKPSVRTASAGSAKKRQAPRRALTKAPPSGKATRSPTVTRTKAKVAKPSPARGRTSTRIFGFRLDGSPQSAAVARAVARARGGFAACHERASRQAGTHRYGRVRVQTTIDPGGHMIRPQVSNAPLPGLDACIASVASQIRTGPQPGPSRARATWTIDYAPE